ncbi:hypothetical protein PTKIN_Ptkin12aG0070500 [Pterospermum kingtungense]
MKKLYMKGKVHPSPPPPSPTIADHLSLLPVTILSLTAALSFQDKEVLAYLISNNFPGYQETTGKTRIGRVCNDKEHDPTFQCNCFRCYMWFWARWDSSPNRQLIHEIIEAYEEGLFQEKKQGRKNKKGRRNRSGSVDDSKHRNDNGSSGNMNDGQLIFEETNCQSGEERKVESEMGSIRNIVSFIGDSIWGVWSRN